MDREVDFLKEHLYEIYKYKKSMKDLTYDMSIELLLRVSKALDYQQQKIDKAIEYIKEDIEGNYFKRYDDEIYEMCKDLLEILKGEDNE